MKTITAYHGTSAKFEKFQNQESGIGISKGKDHYFTSDLSTAQAYSTFFKGTPRVIEAELVMNNPLVIDAEGRSYLNINGGDFNQKHRFDHMTGKLVINELAQLNMNHYVMKAKSDGNDGLIINNVIDTVGSDNVDRLKKEGGATTYVIFNSEQIIF